MEKKILKHITKLLTYAAFLIRAIIIFTQNDWVFGLCPSPGILKTREHNVSENGSVSVLR
jgi:hypothetical protein